MPNDLRNRRSLKAVLIGDRGVGGLVEAAEEIFKDGGHAMEWCLSKI